MKISKFNVGRALGWILEDEVEAYLSELKTDGTIHSFIRHSHFSPEDRHGRDFTVGKKQHGVIVQISFGVTISARSCDESRRLHWPIPCFWFAGGTSKKAFGQIMLRMFKPVDA